VGSACRRERERCGAGLARGELGRLSPGVGPVGHSGPFFYFLFFLLLFLFYSEISFCVLKSFSNSNLIEIGADHIGSFKSVFRN
jgi:hypothetical protein